uniref:Uncharacterized protein n=2 Tax=Guillardia theta TaxID=55529 RepID=A0A7S4P3W5_GUITH|mmetsp:Transcript_42827/g.134993  ORF Transcript_42827/g.134993 Transcript_42827/m.134993 type:complete len:471 (+) Transcript_42827:126-1538(+)
MKLTRCLSNCSHGAWDLNVGLAVRRYSFSKLEIMGRPVASEENKQLGLCFAHAVTAPSEDPASVVARSGRLCIFAALEECCPSSIRNPTSAKGRRGLTMIEFNKSLERAGFRKMRDRRIDAATRQEDPTGAGLCLFSFRQWKNPDDESKKWDLFKSWEYLVETFPHFGAECNWEKFLSVCKRYEEGWKPYSGAGRKMVKVVVADRKNSNKSKPKTNMNQQHGNPSVLRPLQWHSLQMNSWMENISGLQSRIGPADSSIVNCLGGTADLSKFQLRDPKFVKPDGREDKANTSNMLELLAAAGAALGTISSKTDQHGVIKPEAQHPALVRTKNEKPQPTTSQIRAPWTPGIAGKQNQGFLPSQGEGSSSFLKVPSTRSLTSVVQCLPTKTADKNMKEHMENPKGIRVSDLLAHDGGNLPLKRDRQETQDKDLNIEDKQLHKAIKLACGPHNKSKSGLDPLLHLWEQANIVGL